MEKLQRESSIKATQVVANVTLRRVDGATGTRIITGVSNEYEWKDGSRVTAIESQKVSKVPGRLSNGREILSTLGWWEASDDKLASLICLMFHFWEFRNDQGASESISNGRELVRTLWKIMKILYWEIFLSTSRSTKFPNEKKYSRCADEKRYPVNAIKKAPTPKSYRGKVL